MACFLQYTYLFTGFEVYNQYLLGVKMYNKGITDRFKHDLSSFKGTVAPD